MVVDDDVDRSTDSVTGDLGEIERFGHDALTSKCCVAMNEDRKHRIIARRFDLIHLCAGHTHHDRVNCFEVRRIGGKFDSDGVAGRAGEDAGLTKVIFHVAGALD